MVGVVQTLASLLLSLSIAMFIIPTLGDVVRSAEPYHDRLEVAATWTSVFLMTLLFSSVVAVSFVKVVFALSTKIRKTWRVFILSPSGAAFSAMVMVSFAVSSVASLSLSLCDWKLGLLGNVAVAHGGHIVVIRFFAEIVSTSLLPAAVAPTFAFFRLVCSRRLSRHQSVPVGITLCYSCGYELFQQVRCPECGSVNLNVVSHSQEL